MLMLNKIIFSCSTILFLSSSAIAETGNKLPTIDTHIHYSHDAWDFLPPPQAVEVLKKAGLKKAFVSSSSDNGTQLLYKEDPELIVPVLRPYRKRGETASWMYDETVITMVKDLLEKNTYAGIGEFHAFGEDIELPVLQSMIEFAKEYKIFLHAHSDSDAIDRIFTHNPNAVVLWAHSGFESPGEIRIMLEKYDNLWADLAFRSNHARDGKVDKEWETLFTDFPGRFMIGTDTFTPERWYFVIEHAEWSRSWIESLPNELANNIAYANAEALLAASKLQ